MLDEKIIAQVYAFGKLWKPYEDGFLVSKMQTNFAPQVTKHYTDTELRCAHPRLYDAAQYLSTYYPDFAAQLVVDRLKRLHCEFHFENTHSELATLYDVTGIVIKDNNAIFSGFGYVYNDSFDALNGQDLLVQSAITVADVWVPTSWLEAKHPGWHTKYEMATELGMGTYEALRLAIDVDFSSNSLPPPPSDLAM